MDPLNSYNDKFSLQGQWWDPDSEDKKFHGILYYIGNETIELKVNYPYPYKSNDIIFESKILLGKCSNGLICTIAKIFLQSAQGDSFTITANYLFIGNHYKSLSDIQFDNICIKCTHLEEWIGFNSFEVEKASNCSGMTIKHNNLNDVFKKNILNLSDENNTKIKLELKSSFKTAKSYKKYELKFLPKFQLTTESKKPFFDFYLRLTYDLLTLLTLLIGEAVHIEQLYFKDKSSSFENDIEIFMVTNKNDDLEVKPNNTLISYQYLTESKTYEKVMKAWFSKKKDLDLVFDLFSNSFFENKNLPVPYFLLVVQCLEIFDRVNSSKNSNDKLKPRITRITSQLGKNIKQKLIGDSKGEGFAKQVATTRNYWIHMDEVNRKGAVTDYFDIIKLGYQVHAILVVYILTSLLKIPVKEIYPNIEKTALFRNAIYHSNNKP